MFRQDPKEKTENRRSKTEEQKDQEIQPENPVLSESALSTDTPPEQISQLEQPSEPITEEESTIIQTDDTKESTYEKQENDNTENGSKEIICFRGYFRGNRSK